MSIWKATKKAKKIKIYSRVVDHADNQPKIFAHNVDLEQIFSGWIGKGKQTPPIDNESFKFEPRRTNSDKVIQIDHENVFVCPVCRQNKANTSHHIIPRKYGGETFDYNLIDLCANCHDVIEIKTEDWIKSKKYYDMTLLRMLILNNGF